MAEEGETLTLVKLVVTYPSPLDPSVEETAFHQFLDYGPEFELSQPLVAQYLEFENADLMLWHLDPPDPVVLKGTHNAPFAMQ